LVLESGGRVHAVLPFAGIERSFSPSDLPAYRELVSRSSIDVLQTPGSDEDAYLAAGKRVVDASDVIFAVWDGRAAKGKGGTADVVAYARQRGCPLIHINPLTRRVVRIS
jgi:hypothetical protein